MPRFEYSNNYTRAVVSFPAHKFPHTSSVYYQCNVRLCINNGGCDQAECANDVPIPNPNGAPRKKRFVGHSDTVNEDLPIGPVSSALKAAKPQSTAPKDSGDLSFDVYSGLYVRDADVAGKYKTYHPFRQIPSSHTKISSSELINRIR